MVKKVCLEDGESTLVTKVCLEDGESTLVKKVCLKDGESTLVKKVCLEDGDICVLPGVELMFESLGLSSCVFKLLPAHTLPTFVTCSSN